MSSQFLSLLVFLLLLLLLIIVTEVLHRFLKWPAEQSRKFLHVSGGIMCLLFPSFFHSHWWLLPLATLAFLLLFISYRKKLLPSVHLTKRHSVGSVLFPLPVYVCFLTADILHDNLYFYLPVSLLTISDTAAEIGGNKWGYRSKKFFAGQKTLAGSVSFFITALPLICGWLYFMNNNQPLINIAAAGLIIAFITTVTELITLHGWDNLSVPAVTLLLIMLFQSLF